MTKARLIQDYLRDIIDAMNKAEQFIAGMDFITFRQDDKTIYAVIRSLEIIGEATKKVPREFVVLDRDSLRTRALAEC